MGPHARHVDLLRPTTQEAPLPEAFSESTPGVSGEVTTAEVNGQPARHKPVKAKTAAPVELQLSTAAPSGQTTVTLQVKTLEDVPKVVALFKLPASAQLVSGTQPAKSQPVSLFEPSITLILTCRITADSPPANWLRKPSEQAHSVC